MPPTGASAEIRQAFLSPLDAFLLEENGHRPQAPAGTEFHFLDGRTFLLPTGLEARTPEEFKEVIGRTPIGSIQYHVFAPRLGMAPPEYDFAAWFEAWGREDIARDIRRLDPYTMTLETLRLNILKKVADPCRSLKTIPRSSAPTGSTSFGHLAPAFPAGSSRTSIRPPWEEAWPKS